MAHQTKRSGLCGLPDGHAAKCRSLAGVARERAKAAERSERYRNRHPVARALTVIRWNTGQREVDA